MQRLIFLFQIYAEIAFSIALADRPFPVRLRQLEYSSGLAGCLILATRV